MTMKVNTRARYVLSKPTGDATLLVIHGPSESEIDQQSSATETVIGCDLSTDAALLELLDESPWVADKIQVFRLVPVEVEFREVKLVSKRAALKTPSAQRRGRK